MVILGDKGLSGKVKLLLDLIFIGGLIIFITLPITLEVYLKIADRDDLKHYTVFLVLMYITGVFALMIVNELRKIFKNLNKMNPFIRGNVDSLNKIGIEAFAISACYIVKIFVLNSFLTIIIAMIFIIGGFFSIILAEVFNQAIKVKEENDLTI